MTSLIYIIYIILFIWSFRNSKFAIMVFIAHLPIVPLIHTNGTIPLNNFLSVIVFYHICVSNRLAKYPSIDTRVAKTLVILLVMTTVTSFCNDIKFVMMHYGVLTSLLSHILNAIILMLTTWNILCIIVKHTWDEKIRKSVFYGFVISSAILSISLFFSQELYQLGFTVTEEVAYSERPSGLFADGDCNGLAGFLCLSSALILFYNHIALNNISRISLIVLLLNSSAIFYTQSRMGFICLLSLITYYVLVLAKKSKRMSFLFYAFCCFLILCSFTDLFSGVIERLQEGDVREEFDGDQGRSAIWVMYLEYMRLSPMNNILWGADRMIFDIVPHNYYIYTYFVSGIIIAVLFVYVQVHNSIICTHILGIRYVLPLIILTVIPLFFLTDSTIITYYVLAVGIIGSEHFNLHNRMYQYNCPS